MRFCFKTDFQSHCDTNPNLLLSFCPYLQGENEFGFNAKWDEISLRIKTYV